MYLFWLIFFFFFFLFCFVLYRASQPMAFISDDCIFYYQTNTSISIWCRRELNLGSLMFNSLLILYGIMGAYLEVFFLFSFFFFGAYTPAPLVWNPGYVTAHTIYNIVMLHACNHVITCISHLGLYYTLGLLND